MTPFLTFVFTPAGLADMSLAIAACRAGGIGIVNAELGTSPAQLAGWIDELAVKGRSAFGVRLDTLEAERAAVLGSAATRGLRWLIVDAATAAASAPLLAGLRSSGVKVLVELVTPAWPGEALDAQVDGLLLKGNEAGGFVGENSSFILLQRWHGRTALPLYVRGGLTPPVAAACAAVGVCGGALDSQVLLMDEARLPETVRALLANLSGNETVAVGDGEHGEYFRVLSRPGHQGARALVADGEGQGFVALRALVDGKVDWARPKTGLLPLGQDICFAAPWRQRYRHLAELFKAFDDAVCGSLSAAVEQRSIAAESPLASALGVRFPIVQGPMTRVSDVAEFANAVAEGGALPMVAFALLKGEALETLLTHTKALLGERPWGIGLLGFAPQALLDEQLASAIPFKPAYAIIAGGRPDQAVGLEASGVPAFLHVPSANLVPLFLQEGARRFIFEGRECGGHIGPLSSFVLWSTMVDRLLAELAAGKAPAAEIELLFAGGIHDALSSAMVQVLVAPLVAAGVKVGILMGSAYLFTREIVSTGAIVQRFQQEVIDCERTVNLESGPGHASRCAYTPFAKEFFRKRVELRVGQVPGDEGRRILDDMIMGRLRIASKGRNRSAVDGRIQALDEAQQHLEGMYMLGQVATLRDQVTDIARLHGQVTDGAAALLAARLAEVGDTPVALPSAAPVDIAIIGLATFLPKANTSQEYWENILEKIDGITEIPSHRWDWRLYFDADRNAKDKIYSKWGGFLDDMAFDPVKYGMPPKSIEAVDPMQLMALQVARDTLIDAGYHEKAFDRERASVILGASGGTGDVGSQYGLRSELPRFQGDLPADVADRLPEWTEDSFAGILLNVIAGRIANRLNFGGVNFTTDAACASSLAAVYQGVSELIAGRSDLVIAGGVDTVQGPFGYLCFSKTQALSPRGRCSTFDTSGDGIVISEGIAMVALKRLADAERDGDKIYGVIKGVGGSSDGNAKGMTAPLPAGQLRAMRRAYAMAGFGPESVGLFEAHGTGTVAGDTAELESTTRLIRERSDAARMSVIGSVKTMIGHTKATAGIAGMVKALLALHHRVLPPHRGVDNPNHVLRGDSPLYLVDEATPWLARDDVPRRAAVSAFGFGGTNFHIVLEEYAGEYREWLRPAASRRWPSELLVWDGADRDALLATLTTFQRDLPALDGVALRDLAASVTLKRGAPGETLAIVAKTLADLAVKLGAGLAFLRGDVKLLPPGVHHGVRAHAGAKVAVLFPGQGSQYPGMGRELAVHFPVLSETLSSADAVLRSAFGERFGAAVRLSHFVHPRGAYGAAEKDAARLALTSTDVAQPAIGAVEAGEFRLMQAFGLKADMFAGHSYGEFVAQYASGAIDFDALMALSAARGRFIVDAAGADGADLGTMIAVNALRAQVEDAIADIDGVIIANHNAPRQSIVSGSRPAVKAAIVKLAAAGIEATELPVAAAFHSSLVKPAQQALADLIDATPWQASTVPVYSNTTARAHVADVSRTKKLMAEHLVRPVEFVAEIDAMYKDGARVFVEIGPKSVLTRLTAKILDGQPHAAVAIDDGTGLAGLLGALGALACAGVDLDFAQLFAGRDCRLGDPAKPDTLLHTAPLSKTTWLLNGSRARRATEPVQQIGITLEQAEANAAASPSPSPLMTSPIETDTIAAGQPGAGLPAPVNRAPPVSATLWRKDRTMDDRRPVPATADLAVAAEYFQTMRQFLETQERVMGMFMGDTSAAMRPALRQRPVPLSLPRVAPAAELPTPVQAPVQAPVAREPMVAPVVTAPAAPIAVPKPTPVVAAQPVVAAAQAVAAVARPAPASTVVTRDKMVDMLLGIVEEKTGYPRDMVGLDQNLESDLGIDSIKRIEVVGAMLQALPAAYREALHDSRNKLNTQPTLNGMLELLGTVSTGGAVTVPFEVAEAGTQAAPSLPPRHVVVPETEPVPAQAARQLASGTFILSGDAHGVAAELARRLGERGHAVEFVPDALLTDEEALLRWCADPARSVLPLAGVLHLAALGRTPLPADASTADWRQELLFNEKSLFLLLRAFTPRFADGAHVLAATSLGGLFGRGERADPAPSTLSLQGGAVGKLKSLREERPGLRVKAVDLDLAQPVDTLAATLLTEIELDGGRQEVGYPAGVRTIFRTVAAAAGDEPALSAIKDSLVVLASGGARGITAEVLRELARPGNTLVLTGRVALPEREAPEHVALADADALRQHFIGRVRSGELKLTPAEVHRHVQTVLARREMRANIDDFRRRGAAVEYHTVDVLHEQQVAALIADLYARHGAIGGVVHGAGVIEDKLLADKSSESWSRVVETKVLGLLLLQKYLRPGTLRFLSVFSSVAGRYGNSGQSDYALGNELMNRLSLQLQQRWGARVNVHSLCWGPWGATQNGAGMVTAETEAKFAQKGVALVTSPIGRQLFREELQRAAGSPVEIVCGQGPWEQHENEVGAFRLVEATGAAPTAPIGPLLGDATTAARPTGDQVISLQLDGRHRYLQEHCIDGTPILPAAAALEMLAEAAQALWPGWKVVEVHDFKLMKGVELKADARGLQITINPPPYGSSEGFEVNAALQTDLGNGRALTHYRCVIRLEQQLPTGMPGRVARHTEQQLSVAKAYGEWLFHGPRFQVIEAIDGLSNAGAAARVRSTHPSAWLAHTAADSAGWLFDPALLDAAAQMAWLWARAFRDESALPARFGRVVRYRDVFPARMLMAYERVATTDASLVRANVYFYDEAGELVMLVEELDSVASAALNRLGGTARSADNVPV